MTKRLVIISGIVTIAALVAAAVAYFLMNKTGLFNLNGIESGEAEE